MMTRLAVLLLFLFPHLAQTQNFNFTLQSTVSFPGQTLANVWGYSAGGRHYALVGAQNGMVIVDITAPSAPVTITTIPGPSNLWKEIKTYGNYAYVVSEGGFGVQVVNLSALPSSSVTYQSVYPVIPGVGTMNSAHALHVDETKGYLYIYGSKITSGSLVGYPIVLNLNGSTAGVPNAWTPQYAGKFVASGMNTYVHDGYADNDMLYAGHIYAGKFTIVNMANKAAPVQLGSASTPTAFTHNTWKSGDYLFTTDETSNVQPFLAAYNVADPTDIEEVDRLQVTPGSGSIVHNTHVKDNYAVTSWYKDGVVIVDVNRPANMVVSGWYDTYTAGSGSGFEGCWGVYPYFSNSNLMVATNIGSNVSPANGTLYVLEATYQRACYLEGVVRNANTNAVIQGALVELLSSGVANETSNTFGEYKMGRYTPGTFTLRVTKSGFQTYTASVTLSTGVLTLQNVLLQPAALPVELTAFDAVLNKADQSAALHWSTETEANNWGFEVQQSKDGLNWEPIGFVAGKADAQQGAHYSFDTRPLPPGNWLFRLAQKDTDGTVNFSNIRSVTVEAQRFYVRISPNPATATAQVEVNWADAVKSPIKVEVFNGGFQLVHEAEFKPEEVAQQLLPLQVASLPVGKYLVRITTAGGKVTSLPLLKL